MCFFSRDDLQNSPVSERTNTSTARDDFFRGGGKNNKILSCE
jgi:hypothetical protein